MASKKRDCSAISDDSRDSLRVAPTALSRPDILCKASVLDSVQASRHPAIAFAAVGCDRFKSCFRGRSPGINMSNQRDSSTIYKLNVILNLEDHYETHSHTC